MAPETAGWTVEKSRGAPPPTGPIRLAYAVVDPAESVARTARLSVWPTSFPLSARLLPVTPWSIVQCPPIVSQRYH
jgi:hypothetical protein